MKNSKKIWIGATAFLLLASGLAYAGKEYRELQGVHAMFAPEKILQRVDANGDSALSIDEVLGEADARFDSADQNGDGVVTKAEIIGAIETISEMSRLKRHAGKIMDRMVYHFDINDDGELAKSEIENRLRKFYAVADWNDDDTVELAEVQRLRKLRGHKRRGHKKH